MLIQFYIDLKLSVNHENIKREMLSPCIFHDIHSAFALTLTALLESFHSCCLSNVKQEQMMVMSATSVKSNAGCSCVYQFTRLFLQEFYLLRTCKM